MPTDTSEKGLESLIVASLTGRSGQEVRTGTPTGEHPPAYDNTWYIQGAPKEYDRDPRELLFQFGRCAVHFAVDDQKVWMCTFLEGKDSWFLPFNKGFNDGAGNPPNPGGIKTDYLWKEGLTPRGLTDILENYAQLVERRDEGAGRRRKDQIFPRYHQLGVVRALLADAGLKGVGHRYLIQHSAGSGKSNSIAWLVHHLVGLKGAGMV